MTLAAFLSVVAIHLVAAVSPGPSFVMALRIAASEGFGSAVALALGFGLGAVLWAVAALAGLALLFEWLPGLFTAMKIVGALFLLWVAWQTWRHAPAPLPAPGAVPTRTRKAAFRLGFMTFATNPKPAIFFGAVFVGLVPQGTPLPWLAAIVAAVFVNETGWYIFVARVFSAPRARAVYGRLKTGLDRVFATLIGGFAAKIALG